MRIALHTRLAAGAETDYTLARRDVPAELVQAIRDAGARSWTIWRSGRELFHVLECDDYPTMLAQLAPSEVNIAWQERMAHMQVVRHDYSDTGTGTTLPLVWDLASEPRR